MIEQRSIENFEKVNSQFQSVNWKCLKKQPE